MGSDDQLHYDILILGGGFAGVYCAKEVAKRRQFRRDHRIALLSEENYMVFQPLLPEVAAASISPRHVVNPIRQMCAGIDVFKANIQGIDPQSRAVRARASDRFPSFTLKFDHLVVALGAVVDLSRIPGMTEHALLMRNVGDAMRLRATVIARFEEANTTDSRELRRKLLTFVVVGGGYSGVETAGEIHDLMCGVHRFYSNVGAADFRVVLVHSGPRLLETLSDELASYAQKKLQARGVEIRLGERVASVTAQTVSIQNGDTIATANVISTIGSAPNPLATSLAKTIGLSTHRGRLICEPSGRVADTRNIWAAGDIAAIPLKGTDGKFCAPTAQFAQRQGTLVGKNLLATYQRKPLSDFEFTGLGELAAIGHRTAVANIIGMKLSGFPAWWLWRSIYLLKLPSLQRKLRVVVDWTLDLFFPRDINLLNPSWTRLTQETFLQTGDVLYRPGEPAYSLYFVKQGSIRILDGDQTIKEVGAGRYFGERALMGDGIWRFKAVATEPTALVALAHQQFTALLESSRDLEELFRRSALSYLSAENLRKFREQVTASTGASTVRDVMNTNVDSLRSAMTIREALAILRERRHGSYPLLGDNDELLGSVNRDDVYDLFKQAASLETPIANLTPRHLPTLSADANVSDALDLLQSSGRNKALVLGPQGELLGLVTWLDLIR